MKLILCRKIAVPASVLLFLLFSVDLFADDKSPDRRIPDEFETVGGHSLALSGGGIAALGGVSSIKTNPGMLPLEPQYTVGAGYNWPSMGRDFYQVGVVDSVTGDIAAGLIATGFNDDFDKEEPLDKEDGRDSNVEKRFTLAFAKAFNKLSLGISGQYVVGYEKNEDSLDYKTKKGTTLGIGVAGFITKQLRFGASVENLTNRKMKDFAPQTIRVGLAYLLFSGNLSFHIDYRERERISYIEGDLSDQEGISLLSYSAKDIKGYDDPERMVYSSFSARIYNMLRLLGCYGYSLGDDDRQSLSGGIGLVHQRFSLSYSVMKPYLDYSELHNAINLNIQFSM